MIIDRPLIQGSEGHDLELDLWYSVLLLWQRHDCQTTVGGDFLFGQEVLGRHIRQQHVFVLVVASVVDILRLVLGHP